MKKSVFPATVVLLSGLACVGKRSTDSIREFIPGRYVYAAAGEYSITSDTVLITALPSTDHFYEFVRTSTYCKIRDGKLMPPESKKERWTGVYDEEKQLVTDTRGGRIYGFNVARNLMQDGNKVYRKISR